MFFGNWEFVVFDCLQKHFWLVLMNSLLWMAFGILIITNFIDLFIIGNPIYSGFTIYFFVLSGLVLVEEKNKEKK